MKNIFLKKINNRGFSLIEVLIACTVITIITMSLMSAATKGIEFSSKALKYVQANMLLEEGAEATKSIRDTNWDNVSGLSGVNYLLFTPGANTWSISPSNPVEVLDNTFTRKVEVSQVFRDNDFDIASSGTLDSDTKMIKVTVSWNSAGGANSKDITFYLTNIFN